MINKKTEGCSIKNNNNGNKNVPLKEYFDIRFNDLKSYMDTKFENIEKSSSQARETLNARLESMNEFRESLKDQTAQYITRIEHEALITKYDSDIRYLRECTAKADGKASQQSVNIAYILAGFGLIIGIIGIVVKII